MPLNTFGGMNTEHDTIPVSIRLEPEQIARIDELAAKTYRRRSDILRMAVDLVLSHEGCAACPPAPAGKEAA